MFDVGWSELLLIGVVALIVVGPEDLPRMFHTLGRMTAKARRMAREFSSAMEDAAKQSGIKDAADSLNDVRSLTSKRALGLDALDRAADKFEKWDPKLPTARGGMTPDPGLPAAGSPSPGQPEGTAGPTLASPASAAGSALTPPATAAAAPDAPTAVPASAAEDAPGRRSLKAVRRSDLQA